MKTGRKRIRPRPVPIGQCIILSCRNKAIGDTIRCEAHLAQAVASNRAAREYRRLLGLCKCCTKPATPGFTRCKKHLRESAETHQRRRDREATARGWRMQRVPI